MGASGMIRDDDIRDALLATLYLLLLLADARGAAADTAQHFRAELHGVSMHLALDDCEVFRCYRMAGGAGADDDFYPMLSVCQGRRSTDSEYVSSACRQALGAVVAAPRHLGGVGWTTLAATRAGRWVKPGLPDEGECMPGVLVSGAFSVVVGLFVLPFRAGADDDAVLGSGRRCCGK
jgi:hypothetical protein